MSGVYADAWSPRTCPTCGIHYSYYVVDDGNLSLFQIRCGKCRFVQTLGTPVGNEVRANLAKSRRRAHVFALVAIGELIALGAVALAASALAAMR